MPNEPREPRGPRSPARWVRDGNMPNGSSGNSGNDGKTGVVGLPGISHPTAIVGTIQFATHNQLALLASSRQLAMVLHSAELAYLNEDFAGALDRLLWTHKMTDTEIEPGGTEITPLVALDSPMLNERVNLELLASIRERSAILIQQLASGLDFYGFVPQYVELVDKAFYDSYLQNLLQIGEKVESRQEEFWSIRNNISKVKSHLAQSLGDLQTLQGNMERELHLIGEAMIKVQDDIAALNEEIAKIEVKVQGADQSFKDAVARQAQGCNFSEVLSVISSIVAVASSVYTAGGSLVALGGAVSAFAKASDRTREEVEKLNDSALAKYKDDKNIITVVKQVGATAESIGKGYNAIKNLLDSSDDNRAKLMLSKEEYAKTLEPFMLMPEAQALKSLLDSLFGIIESRNNKCVEYTAGRLREDLIHNEIAKAKIDAGLVAIAVAGTNNEEIFACSSILDAALWRLKLQIIKALYLTRKSIELYGLREVRINLHNKTIANLNSARADLKIAEQEITTNRGHANKRFNPIRVTFDMNNAKELLEQFMNTGSTLFTIRPTHSSAFASTMREVRATKLRIWINGISPANKKISLLARHEGNSKFITVGGRTVDFVHRPRPHSWKYDTTNPSAQDFGSELGGEQGLFVDISPFATWSLRIDRGENTTQDLAGLTSVDFEFEGTFLPIDS